MKQLTTIFTILSFGLFLNSCTDVIDVQLAEGDPLLVVDAWITNDSSLQTIKLRTASAYFDNTASPIVSGAIVAITDNNNQVFPFEEDGVSGNYIWNDSLGIGFGAINDSYNLSITIDGATYTSSASMNRVPAIDSFFYEEFEPTFVDAAEEGWEAQVYARDFDGPGDTYWIKAFKNNSFLNKPQEINLAFDAGFTGGSEIDGITFIEPIRSSINRSPDSGDDATDTNEYPPYVSGDTLKVEIHAINNDAFEFLLQAQTQLTLGDNGIFASPLENVPTNITTPTGAIKAVGFFDVAAVESLEEIVP